ncbi:hypothetical protein H0H92_003842 [Tricholoma furcatifolium]|nr:hypothetical protein H0H92_003842 [Tricholoma furcatifolium]
MSNSPQVIASPLVGLTSTPGTNFDDNATTLPILSISQLQFLWTGGGFDIPYLSGLQITYVIEGGTLDVTHGTGKLGPQNPLVIGDNQFVVGLVGNVNGKSISDGPLRTLGILVYDNYGSLTVYNSVPPLYKGGPGPEENVVGFSFLGLITDFYGIVALESEGGQLLALGVYYQPGYVPGIDVPTLTARKAA